MTRPQNGTLLRVLGIAVPLITALVAGAIWVGTVDTSLGDHLARGAHVQADQRLNALERADEVTLYRLEQIEQSLKRIEDKLDRMQVGPR